MNANGNIARFKELLLRFCGHHFENEREQTLVSAVKQRMHSTGIDSHDAYHALLVRNLEETHRLAELLTINETYFFREPDHLNHIADTLLPPLLASRKSGLVRIVSAGCSTGEEPYSIAMMLRERYGQDCERLFAITGVDIDTTAIACARQGVYGRGSFRGMDQTMLERYFEPNGQWEFRIRDAVRKQVGFEVVNLLGSTYPESMLQPDIILYRNVSIYFPQQVQREIFGKLAGLLADGGSLFVSATETIHHNIGILTLVEQKSLFYYRKTPPIIIAERRKESRHVHQRHTVNRHTAPVPLAKAGNQHPPAGELRHRLHSPPLSALQDIKERFDSALNLAATNQADQALVLLDAVIGQDRSFTKAYTLKGSLLLNASRFKEAAAVCAAVLGHDTLCLEAYLMLGIIARHNRSADDALKRFREALYLNASCWPAHFFTGELLFEQQDLRRARSSYEAALRILEKGDLKEHGQAFFPLSFNAEQFVVICRHKLSLVTSTQKHGHKHGV